MREIWFRSSTKCCAASRKMDIRSRPLPLRLGSPGRRFITLILDEDGIYDPTHFNDRLLLGLKGTMSEAELHVIRARLQGGLLNKAKRGELQSPLPVGFIYNAMKQPILDVDKQVQQSLRYFFETFHRIGSALATVKAFRKQGLLFPRRPRHGLHKGDLLWVDLTHSRAVQVLHR